MFLKIFCRFILTILGWKEPNEKLEVQGNTVLVYPHSSLFDFPLGYLYAIGYSEHFKGNVRFLMTERFSWLFYPFTDLVLPAPDAYVRYFMDELKYSKASAIALTLFKICFYGQSSLQKSSARCNTTEYLVKTLNNTSNFIFFISPSGSRTKNESWKTGYLSLATRLNVPITVLGLSYATKNLMCPFVLGSSVINEMKEASDPTNLQSLNSLIKPILIPHLEAIGTLESNSLCDYPTLTSFIGSCLIVPLMFKLSIWHGLLGLTTSIVSLYYHYTTEVCFEKLDVFLAVYSVFIIFQTASIYTGSISILQTLIFCLGFFYLGKSWHCTRPRKNHYDINHSLFHLFLSFAGSLVLQEAIDNYKI